MSNYIIGHNNLIRTPAKRALGWAASDNDAKEIVRELNALRKVANAAAAFLNDPAARPLGCLPAEADDLIDALLAAGLEVRA